MQAAVPWSEKSRTVVALAFCLLPAIAFYALLWREMRPVPMFDDYHAILMFALSFKDLPGPGSKLLYLLAAQHGEYKLVVEHAVVAADLALTGHVHFGFLILLGNALVLVVAYVLWRNTFVSETEVAHRFLLFAPVCYLLFQLNSAENFDWAMCGLQTMPVVLFTLASLHFLLRKSKSALPLACLCAMVASLASANGFLLAPIGLAVLIGERRVRGAALWCASEIVALCLYLYRYVPFVVQPTDPHHGPLQKGLFFLAFTGGAIENIHHVPVKNASMGLGLLIVATMVHQFKTRLYRSDPFGFWTMAWYLLSAAVVAQVRVGQGLNLSLTGRYKIYSDLLLIACYVYWMPRVLVAVRLRSRRRLVYAAMCGATMLFAAAGDLFGDQFLNKRQGRVAQGLNEYVADPAHNPPEISLNGEPFAGGEPELTRTVLTRALKEGIYTLPTAGAR